MYLGQSGLGVAMLFTFGFCGVGQILDLLLLPRALEQANRCLGLEGHNVSMPVTQQRPQSSPASQLKSKDDELDQLLRQAEHAVQRAEQTNGEN